MQAHISFLRHYQRQSLTLRIGNSWGRRDAPKAMVRPRTMSLDGGGLSRVSSVVGRSLPFCHGYVPNVAIAGRIRRAWAESGRKMLCFSGKPLEPSTSAVSTTFRCPYTLEDGLIPLKPALTEAARRYAARGGHNSAKSGRDFHLE